MLLHLTFIFAMKFAEVATWLIFFPPETGHEASPQFSLALFLMTEKESFALEVFCIEQEL